MCFNQGVETLLFCEILGFLEFFRNLEHVNLDIKINTKKVPEYPRLALNIMEKPNNEGNSFRFSFFNEKRQTIFSFL